MNEISNLTFVNRISSTYKDGKTKTLKLADAPPSLYLKNIFDALTAFSYTLKCNNYIVGNIGDTPIFFRKAYLVTTDTLTFFRETICYISHTLTFFRETICYISHSLTFFREAICRISHSLTFFREAICRIQYSLPSFFRQIGYIRDNIYFKNMYIINFNVR